MASAPFHALARVAIHGVAGAFAFLGAGRTGDLAHARDAPTTDIQIDAVFIDRSTPWWLVDDGIHRTSPPPFVEERGARAAVGEAAVLAALHAIEVGEGGGFADGTGLGPPASPSTASAGGIRLVASVRDAASVLLRDVEGRVRVVRASRVVESDDVVTNTRSRGPTSVRRSRASDVRDLLAAARHTALIGDATATLALVERARTDAERYANDRPSLDLLEAQALERLGRFSEAGKGLFDLAARLSDARAAQACRARGRTVLARQGPTSTDGQALARATQPSFARSSARSSIGRRARLAAAALAIEAGDAKAARRILDSLGPPTVDDDLSATADVLAASTDALERKPSRTR